jgi:hypothetical protein
MGLGANGTTEKSELWTSWHGNAPASEAEVLLAIMQQFLHATQLLDHLERRAGMGTEFGEVWAWHERFHADSGL